MKVPQKILVIVTRRIGDVLLATPLIRTIREAWPNAAIDVLVFKGTEGIISGNPDIRKIITVEEYFKTWSHFKFLLGLIGRYDVAFSTMTGDRQVFYAWLAGKYSVGLVPGKGIKYFWKRCFLSKWVYFDNLDTHTVLMDLKLAELLGLQLRYNVIVAWRKPDESRVTSMLKFDIMSEPFAVIHMHPKFPYKEWSRQGWIALAEWLDKKGINMVFTGSGSENETAGMDRIFHDFPGRVSNMIGKFNLCEIGFLLSRASVYIGPDTVITHMAAALGISTVALYGPTNPVKWGPWPKDHLASENPFVRKGSQIVKNVFLIQGEGDCVPCREEGCDRHIESLSKCLQNISPDKLIAVVQQALEQNNKAVKDLEFRKGKQ
jgi:heptosyltransferase-3